MHGAYSGIQISSIEEQEKYRIEKWKVNGELEVQKREVVE
jgi:hypothetical protein